MLLELTVARALQLIGPSEILMAEDLVPARFPLAPNSPYRHGYDWLYHVERRLIHELKPWLAAHRLVLIGEHGLLSEGLSNAFCHGHGRDPQRPIHMTIRVGEAGVLVEIRDTGPGFTVRRTLQRFHAGKAYYSVAGNGMQRMAESQDFGVFFNSSGNAFHLLHLFAGDLVEQVAAGASTGFAETPSGHDSRPPAPESHMPPPDLNLWIRGAVLRAPGRAVHRVSIGPELADALLRMGSHLLRLSEEMMQAHLKAGLPEMIHIQTPQAGLLFCRKSGTEIAVWLNPDTNPTMAGRLIKDYLTSINKPSR
jgi:hypothetical protein